MFRFVAKSMLASVLFKKYKRLILSTLALFTGYFVIALIHDDYLQYLSTVDDTQSVGITYLLKWCALSGISALYYMINFPPKMFSSARRLSSSRDKWPNQHERDAAGKKAGGSARGFSEKNAFASELKDKGSLAESEAADPFSAIRKKKALSGKGDKALKG